MSPRFSNDQCGLEPAIPLEFNTIPAVISRADLRAGYIEKILLPDLSPQVILESNPAFNPERWLPTYYSLYPQAFNVLALCGVHPQLPMPNEKHEPRSLNNRPHMPHVGYHSLTAAAICSVLANLLATSNLISREDAEQLPLKALLHDCDKPLEQAAALGPNANQSRRMLLTALHEKELLRLQRAGISDRLLALARRAWSETGLYATRRLLAVDHDRSIRLVRGQVSQKILYLADLMSFKELATDALAPHFQILTPWEHLVAAGSRIKKSWLFEQGLGINPAGRLVALRNLENSPSGIMQIGSHAFLRVLTGTLIAQELKLVLDPTNDLPAAQWVKIVVQHRLTRR